MRRKIMIALAAVILLSGCKTTKVMTVEKVRTDTFMQSRTLRDSIWLHDSVLVKAIGDTVTIERWHTRLRDRLKMDTVYQSKTDTVVVYKEIVKDVTNPITITERSRMLFACIVSGVMIAILITFWKKLRE